MRCRSRGTLGGACGASATPNNWGVRRHPDDGRNNVRMTGLQALLRAVGPALAIASLGRKLERACAAAALAVAIGSLFAAADPAAADNAVGIYSEAQAARGERLYETNCSACHGGKLEGKTAVPLSGDAFSSRWADLEHSVDDLLYIVRTQMPYSHPGRLSKHEDLDIVTYTFFYLHRAAICELAEKAGLPAICGAKEYADAGGLISFTEVIR